MFLVSKVQSSVLGNQPMYCQVLPGWLVMEETSVMVTRPERLPGGGLLVFWCCSLLFHESKTTRRLENVLKPAVGNVLV